MAASRLGAVAIIAAALLASVALAQRGQIATNQAVLSSMYGDVQVRHGVGGYHPAKLNEVLSPNDAVKTGASSRAELSVGEGGYVRMDENSQILITALDASGTTSFQTIVGGIWVTIERALGGSSKFEVRMPSAVASVKGTVFRCTVDDDGNSETYVYEGGVEVEAGEDHYRVAQNERCRVPRDLRAVVDKFNLSGDDEATWVMYNRHRDIVRHLGDPSIIVALREHQMPQEGVFLASKAVGRQLALHGLHSTSIADADASDFSFNADGTVNWRRPPHTDYCVIGDVTLQQVKQLDGRHDLFSARVRGEVKLVRDGESSPLTSIETVVPGVGLDEQEAVNAALASLGLRVGKGLAPRVIHALLEEHSGLVRIEISNATRAQVAELRRFIAEMDGVLRAALLHRPGRDPALAVVTERGRDEIARGLKQKAGDALELLSLGDRVLMVKFKGSGAQTHLRPPRPEAATAAPAQPQVKPQERPGRQPQHPFRRWPRTRSDNR